MIKTSLFALFLIITVNCEDCGENYQCVTYPQCKIENSDIWLYPCETPGLICCPEANIIKINNNEDLMTRRPGDTVLTTKSDDAKVLTSRSSAFPENCGVNQNDDRVSGGKFASIGQFPWMALLGYEIPGLNKTSFECGGTLITDRHILTAAHCTYRTGGKLSLVRLGELDITSHIDCDPGYPPFCANPFLDVPIHEIVRHEEYRNKSLKNDLALLILEYRVGFTDFISPICLPFDMDIKDEMWYDHNYQICGWGKTKSGASLGGSEILQFANVNIFERTRCLKIVPAEVREMGDSFICAIGPNNQDSCKGDSGGPLFNLTIVGNSDKYIQYGIVSFKPARDTCGDPGIPSIYTRVDAYLDWIVKNVN